jgi:LCP family protein required for cell wall assembly
MQRILAPNTRLMTSLLGLAILVVLSACSGPDEASTSASPSAEPTASPTPELNADLLDQRWTVLYLGTDMNTTREEDGLTPSTDAIMVVSVAADQSEVAMISLPRDTVDVPLPDGSTYRGKINALYEEQGIEAVVGAMEELYQIPIDGHVVLDMEDFTQLVGAVDGVDVNPEEPLVDPIVQLDLEAGPQELDAATTLAYVRTRVDQDYGRMGRQQEVVASLIERLTDPERDLDIGEVLDGLDSLETDLPLEELPTLLEVASRATDAEVSNLVIQPPLITFEGDRGDGRGYILEADVEAIRAEVSELIGEE